MPAGTAVAASPDHPPAGYLSTGLKVANWQKASPLPNSGYVQKIVASSSKLYVLSYLNGAGEIQPSGTVSEYNPGTDTWRTLATGIYTGAAMVAGSDDLLYFIGGYLSQNGGIGRVEVFRLDPRTGGMTAKANLPSGRRLAEAVSIAGKIYVFAGQGTGATTDRATFSYDIASNTWQTLGDIPAEIDGVVAIANRATVCQGNIYLAPSSLHLYVFDTNTNTWQRNGILFAGQILANGSTLLAYDNEIGTIDLITDTITPVATVPAKLNGLPAAILNGSLYIASGNGSTTSLSFVPISSFREIFLKQ